MGREGAVAESVWFLLRVGSEALPESLFREMPSLHQAWRVSAEIC